MIKQLLTAASFALGGAGVVLVGYLSSNPLAFTHPVGNLPTSTPILRPLADTPMTVDLGSGIVMPEVTISAFGRRATRPAGAEALAACSECRAVGPLFVAGSRRT